MIPIIVLALMVGAVFTLALGFAATALHFHARNTRKARRRQALEERWKPLLFSVLAGGDPASLVAAVGPSESLFFVDFVFRYATRLRGHEQEILCEAAAPFLASLVTRIEGQADLEQRARALRTVGTLSGSEHLSDLISALDHRAPLVVMAAARALALRGRPELVDLLLDRADRFRQWSPRFLASLLACAGPSAAEPLRAVVADSRRDPWIRRVAVDALAELNDLLATGVAVSVLAESDDQDLQCACLRVLERVGSGPAAGAARPLMDSADPRVRLCAISALGALGNQVDVPALRGAVEDRDLWIALNAARALRKLGDEAWLARRASTEEPVAWVTAQVLREELA